MTMRTIDIALKKIDDRKHNALSMRAALHGVTIPPRNRDLAPESQLSPEQERAAERALRAAMERKKAEINRG